MPALITSSNLACYSLGQLFASDAEAQRANSANARSYFCSSLAPSVDCAADCKARRDFELCLNSAECLQERMTASVFCLNDGTVSASLCRAKCRSPTVVRKIFDCTLIKRRIDCEPTCQAYVQAESNPGCAGKPAALSCARNGLVYTSDCTLKAAAQMAIAPPYPENQITELLWKDCAQLADSAATGSSLGRLNTSVTGSKN